MVTSSWVGPTPPDVNTTSWSRLNAATSRAISSISSGMTAMRRTSTPSARSSQHRYAALASAILPERISLPTRTIPAVFGMAPGDSTMLECDRPREGDVMIQLSGWALTLGASSGFGEAVSLALARAGLHVFGVHLDRKATQPNVERIGAAIRAEGREARFFNINAADAERRAEAIAEMQRVLDERGEAGTLRVLLHSLA